VINIFQSYILQDQKLGRGSKHGKNRD
jgi:hypothetical protein